MLILSFQCLTEVQHFVLVYTYIETNYGLNRLFLQQRMSNMQFTGAAEKKQNKRQKKNPDF